MCDCWKRYCPSELINQHFFLVQLLWGSSNQCGHCIPQKPNPRAGVEEYMKDVFPGLQTSTHPAPSTPPFQIAFTHVESKTNTTTLTNTHSPYTQPAKHTTWLSEIHGPFYRREASRHVSSLIIILSSLPLPQSLLLVNRSPPLKEGCALGAPLNVRVPLWVSVHFNMKALFERLSGAKTKILRQCREIWQGRKAHSQMLCGRSSVTTLCYKLMFNLSHVSHTIWSKAKYE